MQCDDLEIKYKSPPRLNEIDTALHELGMLSTCTNARREYLRENRNTEMLNMLTINTKYISNVSIGFRVRPITPHVRYKPYNVPKREERHRTRSENNDCNDNTNTNLVQAIIENTIETVDDISQLKKAKSLESIIGDKDIDLANVKLPEVEIVSNFIEKLKVE
ncbi:hypothetical protein QE152_g13012 [Popillia japonica]|uniref:Uncharacterized protein n=1 Tax=Popillia japonica TaxID=7064 RepID=A0AAW1LE24_POPJA